MESVLVASTLPVLASTTHLVVADAFGDHATVTALQASLSAKR